MTQALMLLLILGAATDETPASKRGKHFYRQGTLSSGHSVHAMMGDPPTKVPASVLPCVGCHGNRGRGRIEGGMIPANITWDTLTRPYTLKTETGRSRQPYNAQTLVRAITAGVDSSGNILDINMPRYQLSVSDAADLVAWLKVMSQELDPGLNDDSVKIGLITMGLPSDPSQNPVWRTMQALAGDLNKHGGVYGRKLSLAEVRLPSNPNRAVETLRGFIIEQKPFCLIATPLRGVPPEITALAHQQEIPLIASCSNDPLLSENSVFYLYAGESDLCRVLATHADQNLNQGQAVILTPPGKQKIAQAVVDQCSRMGWLTNPLVETLKPGQDPAQFAAAVGRHKAPFLFYLGPFEGETVFFQQMKQMAWKPVVLVPGSQLSPALTQAAGSFEKLLVALPFSPGATGSQGQREYSRIAQAYDLPQRPGPFELTALSALKLLQEGMTLSGRELSRETLLNNMQTLYKYYSGYSPPVSYTVNQRVGSRGAYLARFDTATGRLLPIGDLTVPKP